MKILHVVTWAAPGNPFGGPLRVALNQADELRLRGHDVVVMAGRPSRRRLNGWTPERFGVRGFRAFRIRPGFGFAALTSPSLWWHAARVMRRVDVVHVHLGRDFVSLPTAGIAVLTRTPFVVQPHGMVPASPQRLAWLLDVLLTRRVMRRAARVFALDERESAELTEAMGTKMTLEVLPNGVPVPAHVDAPATPPEVLFCARLHSRKRPVLFTRMAALLVDRGIDATFIIAGPDEGEGAAVQSTIEHRGDRVRWTGPVEPDLVADHLQRCSVLVHPAFFEPFGMIIIEALATARPVIVTEGCGLAQFVLDHECGLVVPVDDLDALEQAVITLLASPIRCEEMGARGQRAVRDNLSMSSIVDRLERRYAEAADGGGGERASLSRE
jgi:glycosyltransferase involved in cell wall biosynthesis